MAIAIAVVIGWFIVRASSKAMLDRLEVKPLTLGALDDQKERIPIFRQRITSTVVISGLQ